MLLYKTYLPPNSYLPVGTFRNKLFYATGPRRPFLLLRTTFPGRPISMQFIPAAAVAAGDGAGRAGAHHRRLLARGLHDGALLVALAGVVGATGVDALVVEAGHEGGAVRVHLEAIV